MLSRNEFIYFMALTKHFRDTTTEISVVASLPHPVSHTMTRQID